MSLADHYEEQALEALKLLAHSTTAQVYATLALAARTAEQTDVLRSFLEPTKGSGLRVWTAS